MLKDALVPWLSKVVTAVKEISPLKQ